MSPVWRCPGCSTSNGASDLSCVVCNNPRPAAGPSSQPVVAAPALSAVPSVPSSGAPARPPSVQRSEPVVAAPVPAPAAASGPSSGTRIPVAYLVVAALVVLLGGLAFALGRASSAPDGGSRATGADGAGASDGGSPDLDANPTDEGATGSDPIEPSDVVAEEPTMAQTTIAVPVAAQPSVDLVQQWVDALTSQDWYNARAIRPGLAGTSDEQLAEGYGGLKEAQVVYASGSADLLNVAVVAHETVRGVDRTNVYCYRIEVDDWSQTIQVTDDGRGMPDPVSGWIPADELSSVTASCAR